MMPSRRALAGLSFLVAILVAVLWLPAGRAADAPFERGLLFAVDSEGRSPCYLFGTIHSSDPRVLALAPEVSAAFHASRTLVLEAIPDAEAILHSMVTMVYTDGRSLESVVGAALYGETLEAMAGLGMPEAAIKDFKPWAIVTLLSVPPGDGGGDFLDLHLYKEATAAGKEVAGLETIDEQLAVFESLTLDEQVALLRETLAARAELPQVFERLILAYLARDLVELLRLGDEYLAGGDAALAERFKAAALAVRNERMAERMAPFLEAGGCFVAIGALHLPGAGGILDRLSASGHSLRRIY
jgi:uncharacterized protein YbaP (TraB family)